MSEKLRIEDFFGASNHKLIIRNIFAMYHNRWDVLGEGIQNAVDSVLKRAEEGLKNYVPTIEMTYNLRLKEVIIQDNGTGIAPDDVRRIVTPNVSLKNPQEANRGEFGVGLTLVAFSSNDFCLESVVSDKKASLSIKNGYNWAMDIEMKEEAEIIFDAHPCSEEKSNTKVRAKPVRFPEYTQQQLQYVVRRYTAIGDFWSCYKKENGTIKFTLTYINENGQATTSEVANRFWNPADFLSEIGIETVDWGTVRKEIDKGKEYAMPNWIGFGLVDSDTIIEKNHEFTYYALFCRASYYRHLAEKIGLFLSSEEEEETEETPTPLVGVETLNSGIFVCKKGMPLGAIVDHPRTAQVGYWRGIFLTMNCDDLRTEPGRKRLHVDDEQIVRSVARRVFYKLTKFSHYIIPRDPDIEMDSLLREVDKNLLLVREHQKSHPLVNPRNKIGMNIEPANEQTLIGLFHEMIGAKVVLGYQVLKLSAAETYDGVYDYEVGKEHVGREHWQEWLRDYTERQRKEIEERGQYRVDQMIVEFKMHLQDIIKDFLQKTKYHRHIKLIVAWDADKDQIRRKGWLLEPLPKSKQRFYGAYWRLRPSSEGQTQGILATDVFLLKEFLSQH